MQKHAQYSITEMTYQKKKNSITEIEVKGKQQRMSSVNTSKRKITIQDRCIFPSIWLGIEIFIHFFVP